MNPTNVINRLTPDNKCSSETDVTVDRDRPLASSRPKRPRTNSSNNGNEFLAFKNEFMQALDSLKSVINMKFADIEKSLNEIQLSNQEIEKSLEFVSAQYEDMSIKITTLEKECSINRGNIRILEEKIEDLTRNSKNSYFEIRNVPRCDNESKTLLRDYLLNLTKALSVSINSTDIRDVYRLQANKNPNPTIIVELANHYTKEEILRAARLYNQRNPNSKLNSFHITGKTEHTSRPAYIAEHLTSTAKRLYYLGRQLTKSNKYKFCWTNNGKVFMRKAEGSPLIQIKSEEQIKQLETAD
ncbi:uncharacterized protein LOC120633976 [Pararge aegeria]|uniref:Jg27400 protein n=1 Tax=Pararge aegeria aegeria TaxID=348720 RepID=A0A8S4QXG5_9NEOP|nr:uncharacterized protein LOC120633976 [Pararge aegeria]CAH2227272.1 jg27400 [Pararge aegeria aegeria]